MELHSYAPITHTPRKNGTTPNHGQIDNYKSILDDKLSIIDIPCDCVNCTNVFCNNNDHAASIQQMHGDIISACIDASDNIPITKKRKNLQGWKEFVSPENCSYPSWFNCSPLPALLLLL